MSMTALSLLAHPDDAEFLCAGTLIRLRREHGWSVHIATMTPGDCGSQEYTADEISDIRRKEGAAAAAILGATYHCLEERDLLVAYNERTLEKGARLLRQVRPDVVFTHSPSDYMLDHEMTSSIARASAFNAPIPNFLTAKLKEPPLEKIPRLFYCDPVEGVTPLGESVEPAFCIDISTVIENKSEMLAAHASQRDWLMKHHGMDQYLQAMRDWSQKRGKRIGVGFAEGFRQHLGHGYPTDNPLVDLLGVQ